MNKGSNFSTSIAKPETDLTADMIASSVHPRITDLKGYPLTVGGQGIMEDFHIQEVQL